ncbi:ATP12 family chaperone protein [Sphingomonas jaspsi]|uniref:ATP12 family chaperone protein n=1 Tax=Sphingomonas jaspsi TaxID=392409 RepID=UPI0004B68987|nr:ATP12 family protein [Sphingomonas jaspsi]
MKRFWKDAAPVVVDGGYAVELDGRRLKTPARADLVVPSGALAEAVADEWRDCAETVDPRAMPLTGLANAAIDRVAAAKDRFAADLAAYGESDLTCYRADGPAALVAQQAQHWDALIDWARRRYDVDFATSTGIMHVQQPDATVKRLAHEVAALDAFRLAGLSPLVTIGGSLIAALAILEGASTPEDAWEAVSLDDRWQIEQWGADDEAVKSLDNRRRDFLAAARFLYLL